MTNNRATSAGGATEGSAVVPPTITAIWAALKVLQDDVQELQREVFSDGGDE